MAKVHPDIQTILRVRFGAAGLALMPDIEKVYDEDRLIEVHNALLTAASPESVRHLLASNEPQSQPGELTSEDGIRQTRDASAPTGASPGTGNLNVKCDPDQWAQRSTQYVRDANAVLDELRHNGCRWWLYSVSLQTFELVIGEPTASDNLTIALAVCTHIAGPVAWPKQRLRVDFRVDRHGDNAASFTLEDEHVGFNTVGGWLIWSRGYDLVEHRSLSRPHLEETDDDQVEQAED
jgi:hypothetical protein